MSRRELADRVGVTPGAIGNIEQGRHKPSVALAGRIEEALDSGPIFHRSTCECGCGTVLVGQGFAHNHGARGAWADRVAERRRRVLELLAEGTTVGELPRLLGVSRSLLYQDLAELRRRGLIAPRRRAKGQKLVRPADTLSATAVGRLTGIDRKEVAELCSRGELPATRFGREWAIDARAAADLAQSAGVTFWSLREAERQTGLPRRFLRDRLPTYPGGACGARRVEPWRALGLAAQLAQQPDRCPSCGQPVDAGRTWHDDCRVNSPAQRQRRREASRRWWATAWQQDWDARTVWTEQRAAHREYSERSATSVTASCYICRERFQKSTRAASKTHREGRRNLCPTCRPVWAGGLLRARHAAWRARTDIDALRAAYAVGEETQALLRALRSPKWGGRPRNVAYAITVEALHVDRALSDGQVRLLWRLAFASVNGRYVTRLREENKIRRRRTPASAH